jgi:hypothetical protein
MMSGLKGLGLNAWAFEVPRKKNTTYSLLQLYYTLVGLG